MSGWLQASRFVRRETEEPQQRLAEAVDGGLVYASGVALVHPQEPEEASCHGAQGDVGIGETETAGRLASPYVPQSARREPARGAQGAQAGAGQEPGDVGVAPAEPP